MFAIYAQPRRLIQKPFYVSEKQKNVFELLKNFPFRTFLVSEKRKNVSELFVSANIYCTCEKGKIVISSFARPCHSRKLQEANYNSRDPFSVRIIQVRVLNDLF